jgi:hypothetical protein
MSNQTDLSPNNVVCMAHRQVEVEGKRETKDRDDHQKEYHIRQGLHSIGEAVNSLRHVNI